MAGARFSASSECAAVHLRYDWLRNLDWVNFCCDDPRGGGAADRLAEQQVTAFQRFHPCSDTAVALVCLFSCFV